MAILQARQGHTFSAHNQQEARKGWDYCMARSYCKWPAIAGLVVGIVFIALLAFCCLKCCCGCFGGRGRKNKKQQAQSFIPAPYLGYQNANNNVAPPAYGQQPGPQYAHFENNNRKVTEDTLPHMPSWSDARETRVEDHSHSYNASNVELTNLQKPGLTSTTQYHPPQESGVVDTDAKPSIHRAPSPYTGPDFGTAPGPSPQYHQPPPPQQQNEHYTGPDFSAASNQTAYAAYAPSQSTKYEPTYAELGDTQTHTGYQGANHQPASLQAGRPRDV